MINKVECLKVTLNAYAICGTPTANEKEDFDCSNRTSKQS